MNNLLAPLPEQEISFGEGLQDYSEDTPGIYTGGLSEDLGAEEALGAPSEDI